MQSKQSIAGVFDARSAIASGIDDGAEPLNLVTIGVLRSRTLKGVASALGKFLLHFLEMAIAMGVGMAIFAPVKGALVSHGYTALLDTSSLHFLVWMNLFMVVPMVLWMRVRGCGWRHGAEMGIGGAGGKIQGTRPERRDADARLPRQPAMGGRHESRGLLVSRDHQLDA